MFDFKFIPKAEIPEEEKPFTVAKLMDLLKKQDPTLEVKLFVKNEPRTLTGKIRSMKPEDLQPAENATCELYKTPQFSKNRTLRITF